MRLLVIIGPFAGFTHGLTYVCEPQRASGADPEIGDCCPFWRIGQIHSWFDLPGEPQRAVEAIPRWPIAVFLPFSANWPKS